MRHTVNPTQADGTGLKKLDASREKSREFIEAVEARESVEAKAKAKAQKKNRKFFRKGQVLIAHACRTRYVVIANRTC